jgi:flagellar hook-associated protein 2
MATNSIFSGSSRFSDDFQQVIDRSLRIAQLPMVQLQQHQAGFKRQVEALGSLEEKLLALGSSLGSVETASGTGALQVSSSQTGVASAILSGSPYPSSYTVDVISIGSPSTLLSSSSLPTVTNPSSEGLTTESSLTLTVNGIDTTISPAGTSLNDLVAAINGSGAGVEASILNIGSSGSPDYRLFLHSSALGPVTVSLTDGVNGLADTLNSGTLASYKVNGVPAGGISSNSRTVTLAPGLNLSLQSTGVTEVAVSRTSTSVVTALTDFVSAYNAIVDEVNLHRGSDAGVLSGESVINSVTSALRKITQYRSNSPGEFQTLSDFGVSLDKFGKLDFDSNNLESMSAAQLSNLASFLGSPSSGGLLAAANNALTAITDSSNGVIETTRTSMNNSIEQEQNRIDANARRL